MENTKPMLKCNSNTNNGGNCSSSSNEANKLPESPRLSMEFLSRSWSLSTLHLSKSLSHSLPSLVSKSGMMSSCATPPVMEEEYATAEEESYSHSHFEEIHNNNKQRNRFAGNSFSFASSVTSQLVLEGIMNQSVSFDHFLSRLPLEFLSRSWSLSTLQLSKSLSHSLPSLVSKSGMMSSCATPPIMEEEYATAEEESYSHSHFEEFHNNNKQRNNFAGDSFSFASSVTSQLVLEGIMNQSEVSPLISGRPSCGEPLPLGNGGQSCGSIADQLPLDSPTLLCTIKGSARNSVAFLLIILILLSINPCAARPISKDDLWEDTRAGWLFGPDLFYNFDKIRAFIARNGVIGSLIYLLSLLLSYVYGKKLAHYMEEKVTKVSNYLWEALRAWLLMEIIEMSRAGFKLMVDWGADQNWVNGLRIIGQRALGWGWRTYTRGKIYWRKLTWQTLDDESPPDPENTAGVSTSIDADKIRREALLKRYT